MADSTYGQASYGAARYGSDQPPPTGLGRFSFTDRALPFLEIGFLDVAVTTEGGQWSIGQWDTEQAVWGAFDATWTDVSCDVWEASCEYGRAALTDRFVPGTATIIARNDDGWADPVHDEAFGMRPGRAIRFGVDHEEFGRVVIFRGFIDAVVPTYDPWHEGQVELSCVDALGEVNRVQLGSLDVPSNDAEAAHLRVDRLLDRAKWPARKRDIWPTSWLLVAHEQGGQMADLLGQIADSVGGSVWGDRLARIAFRPRDWQLWGPNRALDATIGNVAPTDVCPGAWQRPFDRAAISTQAVMGRDEETAVVVDDFPGQVLYGIEPFVRTDLLTYDDGQIEQLAYRALETRSYETAPRVRSVLIDARNGDAQLDLMTLVDVFKPSHYRARLLLDRGLVFDERYIATAVSHRLTADEWTLELNLDVAAPYQIDGSQSGWDRSLWDQSLWWDTVREARDLLDRIGAA